MRTVLDVCCDEDGVIWCYSPDHGMARAGRSVEHFSRTHIWSQATDIRIAHHHRALCWEVSRRLGLHQRQWLCSAHVAWRHLQLSVHERLMQQARLELPASVGGWRLVTADDVLLWSVLSGEAEMGQIELHPIWPVLSFFDPSAHGPAIMLAGLLVDPRFAVDPTDPDNPKTLFRRLGLCRSWVRKARSIDRGTASEVPDGSWLNEDREQVRMRAMAYWIGGLGLWNPRATAGLRPPPGCRHKNRQLAALRTFACLMRDGWMDAMRTSAREEWVAGAVKVSHLQLSREEWLLPSRYFDDSWLEVWRAHARRWQLEPVC